MHITIVPITHANILNLPVATQDDWLKLAHEFWSISDIKSATLQYVEIFKDYIQHVMTKFYYGGYNEITSPYEDNILKIIFHSNSIVTIQYLDKKKNIIYQA